VIEFGDASQEAKPLDTWRVVITISATLQGNWISGSAAGYVSCCGLLSCGTVFPASAALWGTVAHLGDIAS
jgi:hypothetical protein